MTGLTIAEKVMSRVNVGGRAVRAGDDIDAEVDGLLAISYNAIRTRFGKAGFEDGPPKVWDPTRVYLMNEHQQPPMDFLSARSNYDSKLDATRLGITHYVESEMGVCHQMMLDRGWVRPGEFVIGNDSHTTAFGGINAVSTGVGNSDAAYALAFGQIFMAVPETIKVILNGSRQRDFPFGKDIILYLAGLYGDDFAQDYAIEFGGPAADAMDIAARLTIADHAVEVGATFGVFGADQKTLDYVAARTLEPFDSVEADSDARYARVIEVDCDEIGFQVAKPFTFDNVVPVEDVAGIRIDQARIGSCANGRFEDIEIAARILRGRKVAPHVRFYISPASVAVYRECLEAGLVSELIDAGVQFMDPGCVICQTPGVVLNEEVCITSTTRNYHGRFGGSTSADAQIYLAGPATVAASAIAGRIVSPEGALRG